MSQRSAFAAAKKKPHKIYTGKFRIIKHFLSGILKARIAEESQTMCARV
jgi:hypothetical protein